MALEDMSAVAEPVEAVVEEVEQPDVQVDTPEEAVETPETAHAEEVTVDGRTVPPGVRELFKSPTGGKEIKAAWYERGEFRKVFPEGPKQAQDVMSIIADIGGREGIETLKSDAIGSKEIYAQVDAGDPKLIERMATQSPEGFAKLAPEVMTKWYQVDPEGCNKTLCGVIDNTFRNGQLETNLFLAKKMVELGQGEEALKILNSIEQWSKTFGVAATKATEPKKAPEVDKRVAELDTREAQLFNKDLGSKIVAFRDPMIEKELTPWIPKGQTITETKRAMINREVIAQASLILDADNVFQKDWKSFIGNKDVDGLTKLSRAKLTEILPGVVKNVARELLGSPAVKKSAPTPITQARTPTPIKGKTFDDIFNEAIKA